MLGRGMDQHVAVLAGDGERDLAFEVEMLLAADPELAGDLPRRARDLLGGVAALEIVVREHRGVGDERVVDVDQRHAGAVAILGERAPPGGPASRVSATTTNTTWPWNMIRVRA